MQRQNKEVVSFDDITGQNLLKNAGFEEGEAHWSLPKPVFSVSKGAGRSGGSSLHCHREPSTPYLLCSQQVPAKGGAAYVYSAWVKLKDVVGQARMCIEWQSDYGYISGSYLDADLTGTSDWRKVTFASERIPLETTKVSVILYATAGTTGDIWFDDVELKEMLVSPILTEFPEPVWHGQTIVAGDHSPDMHLRVRVNPECAGLTQNMDGLVIKVHAAEFNQFLPSVYNTPVIKEWRDEAIEISVPTDHLPLGYGRLAVELVDEAAGFPVYREEHNISKVERLRLDVIGPNSIGVVGATAGEKCELQCMVLAQVPPGAQAQPYDVHLLLSPITGDRTASAPTICRVASGETAMVTVPMDELSFGIYNLIAELYEPGGGERLALSKRIVNLLDPAQRPSNAADVLQNGLLWVDGEVTFPIGIYILSGLETVDLVEGGWKFSWEHKNPDYYLPALDLLEGSPINCLIDYSTIAGGREETLKFLDECQRRKLKVILCVKDDVIKAIKSGAPVDDATDILGPWFCEYKDHPSVFATYINDEGCEPQVLPYYRAAHRVARELDPWHPTYSVQYVYRHSMEYEKLTDAYGTDPYYIMGDIREAVRSWRMARESLGPGRPLWAVVQAHGAGYENSDLTDMREPTYEEMRSGTFCAIAEGATGIIYYCLHSMQRSPEFPRRWSELCSIAQEVKDLVPIISLPEAAEPVTVVQGEVSILSKAGDDRLYVLVASPVRNAQEIVIRWPQGVKSVRDFSTGETLALRDGLTSLQLPQLGVRVFVGELPA